MSRYCVESLGQNNETRVIIHFKEHANMESLDEKDLLQGRAVDKSVEEQQDPTVQALAQQCIKIFSRTLLNFLIRRHETSCWIGDPLIELKSLHQRRSNTIFPAKFEAAFAGSMTQ
jgi:hypothetical protein